MCVSLHIAIAFSLPCSRSMFLRTFVHCVLLNFIQERSQIHSYRVFWSINNASAVVLKKVFLYNTSCLPLVCRLDIFERHFLKKCYELNR